jgi:hypothetical protein
VLRMSESISTLIDDLQQPVSADAIDQGRSTSQGEAAYWPSTLTAGHTRRSHPLELFSDSDRSTLGGRGSPARQAALFAESLALDLPLPPHRAL